MHVWAYLPIAVKPVQGLAHGLIECIKRLWPAQEMVSRRSWYV